MGKFKPKPYIEVGTKDWRVTIPRPPKNATHARLECRDYCYDNGNPKFAIVPIKDFACFRGVVGNFNYIRKDQKGKIHKEYEQVWFWNGQEVEGI